MGKFFCMMGKTASGKDTIYKALTEDDTLGLHTVIPYTTRPIREGEAERVKIIILLTKRRMAEWLIREKH